MADVDIEIFNDIKKKLKDMGDGTWAEVIAGILAAGENFIGFVGGKLTPVSAEMTCPASSITYTAGYVVSNNATTTTPVQLAKYF